MELFIFARFHARPDSEAQVAEAIQQVVPPSRDEPGCIAIHGFRSTRDSRLFYIHSRWIDEEAFEIHAALLHTVRFIERMEQLVDQPPEVTRTELMA